MSQATIKFKDSGLPKKLKDAICNRLSLYAQTQKRSFFISLLDKLNEQLSGSEIEITNLKRWWGAKSEPGKRYTAIRKTSLDNLCMIAADKSWDEYSRSLTDEERNLYLGDTDDHANPGEQINEELQDVHEILLNTVDEYNNINWPQLLGDAKEVSFCTFYCGEAFRNDSPAIRSAFVNFFKAGGALTVYLPSILGIKNKFLTASLNKETVKKIIKTRATFTEWHSLAGFTGSLKIVSLDNGFSYFFAETLNKNGQKIFLYSPYQNHDEKNSAPVLILKQNEMQNIAIETFLTSEKEQIDADAKKESLINLEEKKFITWDEKANRVFISLSLSCPGKCKFCYIEKIADKHFENLIPNMSFAKLIAKNIANDKRFVPGSKGTSLYFGGFTDPFKSPQYVRWTMEIIESIGKFGNYFHIATRFLLRTNINDWMKRIRPDMFNVLINYSISQLDGAIEKRIDADGKDARFVEAKQLIEENYKIALYVRPVLPVKTLQDAPQIINLAKEAGITMVTIGGLYTDGAISDELEQKNIMTKHLGYHENKHLILDKENKLSKVNNSNEVDLVRNKFDSANFQCFNSSLEIVNNLKAEAAGQETHALT